MAAALTRRSDESRSEAGRKKSSDPPRRGDTPFNAEGCYTVNSKARNRGKLDVTSVPRRHHRDLWTFRSGWRQRVSWRKVFQIIDQRRAEGQ